MNLRMMLIFGARLRLPARLLGALPSRNSSATSEFLGGCRPHVRPLSDCAKSV